MTSWLLAAAVLIAAPAMATEPIGKGPDLDNDNVRESHDKCPTQPEDVDDYKDIDGCPDRETLVELFLKHPGGAAAAQTRARLYGDGLNTSVGADAGIEVMPGTYTLSVRTPGFAVHRESVEVPEGKPFQHRVRLEPDGPQGALRVNLTGMSGADIRRAAVKLGDGAWMRVHEPSVDLAAVPGSYPLTVKADGFKPKSKEVVIESGAMATLDLELVPIPQAATPVDDP